jgi:hypothetical protein
VCHSGAVGVMHPAACVALAQPLWRNVRDSARPKGNEANEDQASTWLPSLTHVRTKRSALLPGGEGGRRPDEGMVFPSLVQSAKLTKTSVDPKAWHATHSALDLRRSRVAVTPEIVCELGFRFVPLSQIQHRFHQRQLFARKQKSVCAQEGGRNEKAAGEVPACKRPVQHDSRRVTCRQLG